MKSNCNLQQAMIMIQIALPRLDYLIKSHARNYSETDYQNCLVDVTIEVCENKACAPAIFLQSPIPLLMKSLVSNVKI